MFLKIDVLLRQEKLCRLDEWKDTIYTTTPDPHCGKSNSNWHFSSANRGMVPTLHTSTNHMQNIYFKPIVEFYPYRTAMAAGNKIFSCKLSTEDLSALKRILVARGHNLDNHVCWRTENACYMYSDNKLIICTDLTVGRW